jgi:hypothetical protein
MNFKWLWLILLFIAAFAVFKGCRLERKDAETIKQHFLKKTPLGLERQQVIATLKAEKGLHPKEYQSSIEATLGEYFSPPLFTTTVVVKWHFSESNRLDDIEVQKYRDAP